MNTPTKKNILIVHQSAELYGSDVTLLNYLKSQKNNNHSYTVVLPNAGPLLGELASIVNVNVLINSPLKVKRADFNFSGFASIFKRSLKLIQFYRDINTKNYDLVYSNTLAVIDGIIIKVFFKKKHVWHVHEIIEKPFLARILFRLALSVFCDLVVYNSEVTFNSMKPYTLPFRPKVKIIHNGTPEAQVIEHQDMLRFRHDRGVTDKICFSIIGRVSALKGQELLVEAVATLPKALLANIHFFIIGAPVDGDEARLLNLKNKISNYKLDNTFTLTGFMENKSHIWAITDITISASIFPESFGMVIIESWAAAKPVIASNHGGPSELIDDGYTGLLFEPGDKNSLASAILKYAEQRKLRDETASNGYKKYLQRFSVNFYTKSIQSSIDQLIDYD